MWWHWLSVGDEEQLPETRFSNREVVQRLYPLLRRQGRAFGLAAVLIVAATAAALCGPQVLRLAVNVAATGGQESTILQLAAVFLAIVLLRFGLNYTLTLTVNRAGLAVVTELKAKVFRHVLQMPVTAVQRYTPGRLIARVESDGESVKHLFSMSAVRIFESLFMFTGIALVMLATDWKLALPVLILVPLLAGLTRWFTGFIRDYHRDGRRRYTDIVGFITEYVQGVDVVQHYGYQQRTCDRLARLNALKVTSETRRETLGYGFIGLFHLCEIGATAAVIALAAKRLAAGELDIGTLVMFVEYIRQVFLPIQMLSEFVTQMQHGLVSAERVFGLLSVPTEQQQASAVSGAELEKRTAAVPFHRAIRFEDVCFSYGTDTPDVLSRVSFTIGQGQHVALVGPSGGGKTTLAGLLLGFHVPRSGRITVDDIDLASYPRDVWRHSVGLVLQEQHLFDGSLRDNLTVFGETDDTRLLRALELVRAHGLLERLPGGLDGELLERGQNLSMGERQLVSFARAVVDDPPLLVLDEATASVDPQTEREIQDGLDHMLAGRTALIIAHRLQTITDADLILVVESGVIVESGTHAELYQNGDHYRRLHDLQFGKHVPTARAPTEGRSGSAAGPTEGRSGSAAGTGEQR